MSEQKKVDRFLSRFGLVSLIGIVTMTLFVVTGLLMHKIVVTYTP